MPSLILEINIEFRFLLLGLNLSREIFFREYSRLSAPASIQATTVLVETVIVESTVLVEQKPLTTTQFYLLQTTFLVETTVIVEQKTLTVFSTIAVVACTRNGQI